MKVFKVICALFVFGFVSVYHAAVIFITEKDAGDKYISSIRYGNDSRYTKSQFQDEWYFYPRFMYSTPATLGNLPNENKTSTDRTRSHPMAACRRHSIIKATSRIYCERV